MLKNVVRAFEYLQTSFHTLRSILYIALYQGQQRRGKSAFGQLLNAYEVPRIYQALV